VKIVNTVRPTEIS